MSLQREADLPSNACPLCRLHCSGYVVGPGQPGTRTIGTLPRVTLPDVSSWDFAEPLCWEGVALCVHRAEAGLLNRD